MTFVLVLCPVIWYGACLKEMRFDYPTQAACSAAMRSVLKAPEKPARVYCISKRPVELSV